MVAFYFYLERQLFLHLTFVLLDAEGGYSSIIKKVNVRVILVFVDLLRPSCKVRLFAHSTGPLQQ